LYDEAFGTGRTRERVYWWGLAIDPISTIFVISLLGSTAGGMTFGLKPNEKRKRKHEFHSL
jgi:hypothetical protein